MTSRLYVSVMWIVVHLSTTPPRKFTPYHILKYKIVKSGSYDIIMKKRPCKLVYESKWNILVNFPVKVFVNQLAVVILIANSIIL